MYETLPGQTAGAKTEFNCQYSSSPVTKEIRKAMVRFCSKYVVLLEVLYRDQELNQWCRAYSAYRRSTAHIALKAMLYDGLLREACELGIMQEVLSWKPPAAYSLEAALNGSEVDLIYGICMEIRSDYDSNGALISRAIAAGNLYRLMQAFLCYDPTPRYTLEYIRTWEGIRNGRTPGAHDIWHDIVMGKWRLRIRLDEEGLWFLSVFVRDDGRLEKYSLDLEEANDSHYQFVEEEEIRKKLYVAGDETKYFHEILIRHVRRYGGYALRHLIMPYVTEQFHF